MTALTSTTVQVKWQKNIYDDIVVDTSNPPSLFKMQLFSLTGVPPERQKIMGFKGGLLKDDADWEAVGLKNGLKLTMMGTADKVPEAPSAPQTFVEDLPVEEQDHTGLSKYGAGLENLGNTCYMNSTVQCLYAIPELKHSLSVLPPSANISDPAATLASATRSLFDRMSRSGQAVTPTQFLLSLRRMFPQFDQTNREGMHMQQDAEECWGALLTALKSQTTEIQKIFGVLTKAVLKCDETEETMTINEVELSLKCNITSEVNHLAEGLALGLRGDREKTSESLGRLAHFRGVAQIHGLPPYLTVQMVRFFYKADVQQKAKILRKVTFPLMLDLFDFCSDELKAELKGPRLALKESEDAKIGLAKRQKVKDQGEGGDDVDMNDVNKEEEKEADAPSAIDMEQYAGAVTGRYELIGVLTHKGRSADSGHYVSWIKQTDGQWIQFDDDSMILRKEEEVLALSGGGDWHMAYLLLYRAQKVAGGGDQA